MSLFSRVIVTIVCSLEMTLNLSIYAANVNNKCGMLKIVFVSHLYN